MKKYLLFLLPLQFVVLFSYAQGDCTVPAELTSFYSDDFNALAAQYMIAHADSDDITISSADYSEIAEGVAAIFNSSLPERDSVFDMYCVHWPFGISLCKEFLIFIDTSYAWTIPWQHTQTVTGNMAIDNIFSNHNLYVDTYYDWSFGDAVLVKSSVNGMLNYDALIDSLVLVPGVVSGESNALIGTAGHIEYDKTGNVRHYSFFFEWNDCFDGCDNLHAWFFGVDDNCNVTFLGTYDWGAFQVLPLPTPLNCNITTGIGKRKTAEEISLYPNPVSEELFIRSDFPDEKLLSVEIYDGMGRKISVVTNVSGTGDEISADVHSLASGIYVVKIADGKNNPVTKKFVKE